MVRYALEHALGSPVAGFIQELQLVHVEPFVVELHETRIGTADGFVALFGHG